jgi:hypothetical protein
MYNANDSSYDDAYYVDYTEELMSSDTFSTQFTQPGYASVNPQHSTFQAFSKC